MKDDNGNKRIKWLAISGFATGVLLYIILNVLIPAFFYVIRDIL